MSTSGTTTELREITVAHSPDSDDAFMFYALTHDKIDTGGLRFVHQLEDIETLNRRALQGELEVSAVSIHAFAHLADKYALLASGSSMGDDYGPMIIARSDAHERSRIGRGVAIYAVNRQSLLRSGFTVGDESTQDTFNSIPMAGFTRVAFTPYYSAYVRC